MGCHVSFTLVLTILTLTLSLVPAVTIWVVFMDLMTSSLDLLKGTTQESTDDLAQNIQQLLMAQAVDNFDTRLTEGETEIQVQQALLQASGLLALDLRPSRFDVPNNFLTPYKSRNFATMRGHPYFSAMVMWAAVFPNGINSTGFRLFWASWTALFIDLCGGTIGNRTLYLGTLAMAPDERSITLNNSCVDQLTAAPLRLLSSTTFPISNAIATYAPSGWDTKLAFNQYSGQIQLTRWIWLPAQNNTWMQTTLSISANTISDDLAQQLSGSPDDRLVLFFRQPHGYMIAASHGKFYSHSDVDRRYINPLTNPPNLTAYSLWTCLQSNDALIQQACQIIYARYQSWMAIPAMQQELFLGGQLYWVATGFSTGTLQATVLMLKNRASVMGSIDASNSQVDRSVVNKKLVTFVVLGVVAAVAVLLPIAVGLWLAGRLNTLAAGMDRIAKLQFTEASTPRSVFQELHRFQMSFVQMERGLQAFGKFVPQAVVKVLIAGQMKANNEMGPETLTIMFADIEGFSTICEHVPPATLVAVCTEYFEAMCSNIAKHNGTIDKFIGDCIMAMWNAPDRLPGHERDAVATALAMQTSVMQMHSTWQQRGLPLLKFRLGIHTGVCLVGNFGCSYRVSYTCLGDGVNLSARLEALNKKFGTYICVSHATYQGCDKDFHFRRLARVTVPGKAEVLPVYEVLCPLDGDEPDQHHSPKDFDLPGHIDPEESVDVMRLDSDLSSSMRSTGYVPVQGLTVKAESHAAKFTTASPGNAPYHWTYVDRAALLRHADQYEGAYRALVTGDKAQARLLLLAQPLPDMQDKAWTALVSQLDHTEGGKPWDGVFYFREK